MGSKPYGKFIGWAAENKIKHRELAEIIGVTVATFSRKINRSDGYDFTPDEIRTFCRTFNLSADEFFLQ